MIVKILVEFSTLSTSKKLPKTGPKTISFRRCFSACFFVSNCFILSLLSAEQSQFFVISNMIDTDEDDLPSPPFQGERSPAFRTQPLWHTPVPTVSVFYIN